MRLRGAKRIVETAQARASDRARGVGRSALRLSAGRAAENAFADVRRLPVQPGAQDLQNSDGLFYKIPGFSDPAGPDVDR